MKQNHFYRTKRPRSNLWKRGICLTCTSDVSHICARAHFQSPGRPLSQSACVQEYIDVYKRQHLRCAGLHGLQRIYGGSSVVLPFCRLFFLRNPLDGNAAINGGEDIHPLVIISCIAVVKIGLRRHDARSRITCLLYTSRMYAAALFLHTEPARAFSNGNQTCLRNL